MSEHYYTKKPESVQKSRLLSLFLNTRELQFKTSSSMFSPKRVDKATMLLIEYMQPGEKVLDMGCGYGPIGISLAVLKPECSVTMVEINERAADLARQNISLNRATNATVIESDFFENVEGKFDTILMNPPGAIKMDRRYKLIEECKDYLEEGGVLQIVARHNKGGSRLEEKMKEVFGNVETLVRRVGFRVYISYNSK